MEKNGLIVIKLRLFLIRLFRYTRYFFLCYMKEAWKWEYESCKRCGKIFRIQWHVSDSIWNKVMNVNDGSGGSLCVDCFIKIAKDKCPVICDEFIKMRLFYPDISFNYVDLNDPNNYSYIVKKQMK